MITTDALSPAHHDAVRDLLDAVTAHDGISPLDEAARLALVGGTAQHLLSPVDFGNGTDHAGRAAAEAADEGALAGYVSVLEDGTVQGMVHPEHRRRGHGTALLRAALALRPDAGVWAHGALEASMAFLSAAGLHETRRLLTLHRPLDAAHPVPTVPAPTLEGLRLDTFDVERDADRWLEVNAHAFADHPEQGALTRSDLDQRMAEPWFDPEDLLVARVDDELVGFVWVKQEAPVGTADADDSSDNGAGRDSRDNGAGRDNPASRDSQNVVPQDAEIYVVATAPSVQGRGVAGYLLATALERLHEAGVPGVELYVEADNTPALRLYEAWGFTVSGRDVQLRAAGEG